MPCLSSDYLHPFIPLSLVSPHPSHKGSFLCFWFLKLLCVIYLEMEISDEKEQLTLVLIGLGYLTQIFYNQLCKKWQDFIFFYNWILFNTIYVPHFHYPFHGWGIFGCLHFLGVGDKAAINIKEEIPVYWDVGSFRSKPSTHYTYKCSWVMRYFCF